MRSTTDKVELWLPEAKTTASAGASLAKTLYGPVTVFLRGGLGAGKTTFLQGFGRGLGLGDLLRSPTYALEQRYGAGETQLLHIDLYRLTPKDADALVASSAAVSGIRCIEWSERLTTIPDVPAIDITLAEDRSGRKLSVAFRDAAFPAKAQIDAWRTEVHLPAHIMAHCDAVAALAVRLADSLLERGIILRRGMLEVAGWSHDLFRFVDFRPGADPQGSVTTEEDRAAYALWKARFPGLRHEAACTHFLRQQGFPALSEIVEVHGLQLPSPPRATIEQQLLFYADKRVAEDRTVTLRERFDDFLRRYGHGKESQQSKIWYAEAQTVERLLFPDGPPL